MITGFFLQIFFFLVTGFINALPTATPLPAEFTDAITLVAGYASAWSWLLPIYEAIGTLLFVLFFDIISYNNH